MGNCKYVFVAGMGSQGAETACCMAGGPASPPGIGGLYTNSGGNDPAILRGILAIFRTAIRRGPLPVLCAHLLARWRGDEAVTYTAMQVPSARSVDTTTTAFIAA